MSNQVISCCCNQPAFEITYQTGEIFHVCKECFAKPCWSRHIKDNKLLELSDDKKSKRAITVREKRRSDVNST